MGKVDLQSVRIQVWWMVEYLFVLRGMNKKKKKWVWVCQLESWLGRRQTTEAKGHWQPWRVCTTLVDKHTDVEALWALEINHNKSASLPATKEKTKSESLQSLLCLLSVWYPLNTVVDAITLSIMHLSLPLGLTEKSLVFIFEPKSNKEQYKKAPSPNFSRQIQLAVFQAWNFEFNYKSSIKELVIQQINDNLEWELIYLKKWK